MAERDGFELPVPLFIYAPKNAKSAIYLDFMLETSGQRKGIVVRASGPVHVAGQMVRPCDPRETRRNGRSNLLSVGRTVGAQAASCYPVFKPFWVAIFGSLGRFASDSPCVGEVAITSGQIDQKSSQKEA
jgi:hypothetical protein